MIIAHFSDTHGLPRKGVPDSADVVVHSGDLFPNRTRGHRHVEAPYQTQWLRSTLGAWAHWLGGRPLVLVEGNHDFVDPAPIFQAGGINAHNVEGRALELAGVRFMGLPEIPWMGGEWNHERQEHEIAAHIALILERTPDVIVAHCPVHGLLDTPYEFNPGYHIGSTAIATALAHHEHEPKAYLHGHCHETGGRHAQVRSTHISNAATTRRIVEVHHG